MSTIADSKMPPATDGERGGSVQPQMTLFVAVVHAADGIRLLAAVRSRIELVRRLAEYARRRGVHVLRPEHARHMRALITRGELEAAVELYFGLVGERWDKEWLVTTVVTGGWQDLAALSAIASPYSS